ncbi:MAG TPA: PKD domain-containing protein [Deltaproteobacteria bacterium]|nr:PKD domain-containing protein [Deltaproteobacteria bacterium]
MNRIKKEKTIWLVVAAVLLFSSGCGGDSSGGGTAEEEAILEVGIASPSREITIETGSSVEFHGYVSGGAEPYEFLWNFGDAGPESSLKDPGTVIFDEDGVYEVVFQVIDANGVGLSDGVTIIVSPHVFDPLPLADIVSPAVNGVITQNAAVTFQGAVNGGEGPYGYRWNFDGAAPDSTKKDPGSVTFPTTGTYTITYTVTDANGRTSSDTVTLAVNAPTGVYWVGVAAGGDHSAALRSDGTLWAWGANDYGQVGTGTTSDYSTPQRIGNANTWSAVALGTYHTIALRSDGTMWAWGANHRGQLGRGNAVPSLTPVRIGSDKDWAVVAAGALHSAALKRDGTLWVWGGNSYGQVGTGDTVDQTTPQEIGSGVVWVDVAAGGFHTLAMRSDRTMWAWGKNTSGQLGTGGVTDFSLPMQITLDIDWMAMAGGYSSTVALKTDGTLWAWGGTPRRIGSDRDWTSPVAAGSAHYLALKLDGSLLTWGSNLSGQLGTGDNLTRAAPVQVGLDRNWAGVAAGYDHSMGLRYDGTIWAWGLNTSGQLGNGSFASTNEPVRIP